MARSLHGPRAVPAWAVTHSPAAKSRVVRLGRPANDNDSRPRLLRLVGLVAVAAFAALALHFFRVF